ncbi:hypothetical protein [Tropicibacter oceani]|uniref:DUF485 domain-containing protein n=1 Tax=Tropicibacter oceani TaxID=3058420 RepID=A0ABY8QIB2_9RHOB|nr:hypothetical protein [Tropicibacter oceani]WGW03751.1 hypothetical protein QF118_17825 [Tropicibacter oceani]
MTPPTKKWRSTKFAALEASHRYIFRFAELTYLRACIAGVVYLFAFAWLNTFDFDASNLTIFSTIEILLAGLAMASFVGLAAFSGPVAILQWRSHRYLQSIS